MEKRGRGRPKKTITTEPTKTFDEIVVQDILPKKRGRPKKLVDEIKVPEKKVVVLQKKDTDGKVDTTDVFYGTKVINMTPHELRFDNGMRIAESGDQIRVATESSYIWDISGIPVYSERYSVGFIPRYSPNKIYIVSNRVAMVHKDRCDLYIPYKVNHEKGVAAGICRNPYYTELEDSVLTKTEMFARINELMVKNTELERMYNDLVVAYGGLEKTNEIVVEKLRNAVYEMGVSITEKVNATLEDINNL